MRYTLTHIGTGTSATIRLKTGRGVEPRKVEGRDMDEERYRKELLSRLDKILEYLSLSCSLPEACLVESQEEPTARFQIANELEPDSKSRRYLINDEMRDVQQVWRGARAYKDQAGR